MKRLLLCCAWALQILLAGSLAVFCFSTDRPFLGGVNAFLCVFGFAGLFAAAMAPLRKP